MKLVRTALSMVAFLALFAALSTAASITTYTDQSTFTTNTGAIDATAIATVTGSPAFVAQSLGGGTYYVSLINPPGPVNDFVTIAFSQPVTAFGALFDTRPLGPGDGDCVLLSNGAAQTCFADHRAVYNGFWGVVSDTPFTSLQLFTKEPFDEHQFISSLVVAGGSQVPEPSTLLTGAAGLAAVLGSNLRRRRR